MTLTGKVEYEDQSVDNLRFSLVPGPVDKRQLNVLLSGTLSLPGGYSLEAGIIGASHYLECIDSHRTVLFTELFACRQVNPDAEVNLGIREFGTVRKPFPYLMYESNISIAEWPNEKERFKRILRDTCCEEERLEGELGLRFMFPEDSQREFQPLTAVHVRVNKETGLFVTVNTVHAYPNELRLAFTQTTLKMEGS